MEGEISFPLLLFIERRIEGEGRPVARALDPNGKPRHLGERWIRTRLGGFQLVDYDAHPRQGDSTCDGECLPDRCCASGERDGSFGTTAAPCHKQRKSDGL